ncbi:MAG: alpha/beta fold hydrolase [Myxococcota bacterium]|nr:alpha/beta fold hydrolase [Myxococcota bacterium]
MTKILSRIAALLPMLLLFAAPAAAEEITLKAKDGTALHADYKKAKGESAVVLVHMLGRSAKDWRFVADKLNGNDITTLAVDLRKHGANLPEGSGRPELSPEDFAGMKQDVQAAVAHLRKEGFTDIQLIGASIGANLALQVAAEDAEIRSVILLSPGLDYKGVTSEEAMAAYGERPILIVVSKDDRYSAKSGLVLDSKAKGVHELVIYDAAGHGTKMLNKEPELEPKVISWVLGTYTMSDGDGGASRAAGLKTGDTSEVQTEGKKLGEE